MCADKMKIFLKANSVPYRVSAPRDIHLHFQEAANAEISKHIASGVIVPCSEPTDWCSPAFFVRKGDGKRVRLVTDYTKLNKFVVLPVHPFPSVPDIIQSIPSSAAYFSKLDATHGYFQLPLDEEASRLTTFIFPSGRYRYLRASWDYLLPRTSGVATQIALWRASHGVERSWTTSSSGPRYYLLWKNVYIKYFIAVVTCISHSPDQSFRSTVH